MKSVVLVLAFVAIADMARAAAVPPPPAQMQSLVAALGGRWIVTGEFEIGPETPNGGAISGEEVWRSGPGGYTFMQEERLATPLGEMFATGFMWWDATASAFHGMRCQSADSRGCDVEGVGRYSFRWDGKSLVVDLASKTDPSQLAFHEVFSDLTANGYTQTGYSGAPNGLLTKMLTIHAVRERGAP